MTETMKHFSELETWQVGHRVVLATYRVSEGFPKKELFGLVSQMNRAAVSVTSNIAEGFGRRSYKDKARFYDIAKGSLLELENQLIVALDLGYLPRPSFDELILEIKSVHRLLNSLLKKTEMHHFATS